MALECLGEAVCERNEVAKVVVHGMAALVGVDMVDAGDEVGDVGGHGSGDERGGGKLGFSLRVRDGDKGILEGCHTRGSR